MTPPTRDHKYVRLALLLRSMPHFSYVDFFLRLSLLQVQHTFPSGSFGMSLGVDYGLRFWYDEYKWVQFGIQRRTWRHFYLVFFCNIDSLSISSILHELA